jgi:glutaredoxin
MNISLLTLEKCPPCEQVKNWITQNNLEVPLSYYHRDMFKNTNEQVKLLSELKTKKFPQLIIDENHYLGFEPIINKLKEIYLNK